MTPTNWRYRGRRTPEQRREFSDAQRRRVNARWERVHAASAGEPVRRSRVIDIEIRDSHRPLARIRLHAEPAERGWSRWLATENGSPIGKRRFGRKSLAAMIAAWME